MPEIIQLDPDRISEQAMDFKAFLEGKVIGQGRAIKRLVQAYDFALSPLRDTSKPIIMASYFGPSGCGKTFLARCVAEFFFEDPRAMTKIDCTKFTNGHEVSLLVGAPPSYIGYNVPPKLSQENIDKPANMYLQSRLQGSKELQGIKEKWDKLKVLHDLEAADPHDPTGLMNPHLRGLALEMKELERLHRARGRALGAKILRKTNNQTFSVILFDEFEKAHQNLHDNIMDIGDTGELVLMNNETTSFSNSFIFLTSNLGSHAIDKLLRGGSKGMGFGSFAKQSSKDEVYTTVIGELKTFFKTEFLGRLQQDIIVFRPLHREEMEEILERLLGKICTGLYLKVGAELNVGEDVKIHILEEAMEHPEYGARPLEQKVELLLEKPIGRLVNSGQVGDKTRVHACYKDGRVSFSKPVSKSERHATAGGSEDETGPSSLEEIEFS